MADNEEAGQPGQLSIAETVTDQGVRVLALAGEIDHESGGALREALEAAGRDSARVVLDLSQVSFMDSSGINIFIVAHRALGEAGGRLRLAAPTEPVLRTLQIVGVDEVIDCRPTLREALGG
jgi:stage II sporulation protein AA (anti-sigma F factor antagonist)